MQGSKYSEETRERALALVSSGMSCTAAAKDLKIPKSTVSHWWNTAAQDSEDVVAERMEARRRSIARCGRIVDKALGAVDRRVTAAAHGYKAVSDGMAVLTKAAKDGVIGMTEDEVKALQAIVKEFTGVGLREMSATMGDICKLQESLQQQVTGGEAANSVTVAFLAKDSEGFAG